MLLFLPDMAFAVGLSSEGELADQTLEWPLTIVGSEVANESALVSARVAAQVTLVGGETKVGPDMT